jgi:hypothetical protein
MNVSCILYGGLGNQLFQIFTTIAFSIKHNLSFTFLYTTNLGKRQTYWHTLFLSIIDHTSIEPIENCIQINEGDAVFYNPPRDTDIVLNGYFQSFTFFENEFSAITRLLGLDRFRHVSSQTSVSLHFRLGDYKYLQDCHPILDIDYYKNALGYIMLMDPTISHVKYYCEDEDIETVNQNVETLRQEFREFVFERELADSDWEEMMSMSCCKHNIIANSSFSWWGAYLNTNPERIVCYPSVWFGPTIQQDVSSMFPGEWIKI